MLRCQIEFFFLCFFVRNTIRFVNVSVLKQLKAAFLNSKLLFDG